MSEHRAAYESDDPGLIVDQYGSPSPWRRLRQKYDEHTTTPIDVNEVLLHTFELGTSDTILDVGSGDADLLRSLRLDHGYTGRLIALDLFTEVLQAARVEYEHECEGTPIDFVAGSAERLPFASDSIDSLLAMFMLYHVRDIDGALREFDRVVKPGGRIVIATSGQLNKLMHREIEARIADALHIEPPPIFTDRFNTEAARRTLPKIFEVERIVSHHHNVRIKSQQGYESLLASLKSMKNAFRPEPTDELWDQAIRTVVKPEVEKQVDENGYYADRVERDFFLCRNTG